MPTRNQRKQHPQENENTKPCNETKLTEGKCPALFHEPALRSWFWSPASASHAGPCVLKLEDGFHMWYLGSGAMNGKIAWRIGHGTSPDGLHWTKSGTEPVLDIGKDGGSGMGYASFLVGAPGRWCRQGLNPVLRGPVLHPCVVQTGQAFTLWCVKGVGNTNRICRSTSPDGARWTPINRNPVLPLGKPGEFDSHSHSMPREAGTERIARRHRLTPRQSRDMKRPSCQQTTRGQYANSPLKKPPKPLPQSGHGDRAKSRSPRRVFH